MVDKTKRGYFGKEITITHILATVTFILAGMTSWAKMDIRVTVLEEFPKVHLNTHEDFSTLQKALLLDLKVHMRGLSQDIKENRRIMISEIRNQ